MCNMVLVRRLPELLVCGAIGVEYEDAAFIWQTYLSTVHPA